MTEWQTELGDDDYTVLGRIIKNNLTHIIAIPKGGELSEAAWFAYTDNSYTLYGSPDINRKYDVRSELCDIKKDYNIENDWKVNDDYFNDE